MTKYKTIVFELEKVITQYIKYLVIFILTAINIANAQTNLDSSYLLELKAIHDIGIKDKAKALSMIDSFLLDPKVEAVKYAYVKAHRIKANYLTSLRKDSIEWYLKESISLAQEYDFIDEWLKAMKNYALHAKSKKQFDRADSLYQVLFNDPYVKENETTQVSIYEGYASLLINQKKTNEAIDALNKGLSIAERNNYHDDDVYLFNRLGYLFFQLRDYEKSLFYNKKLLELIKDSPRRFSYYSSIGGCYLMLEKIDSAKYYVLNSLKGKIPNSTKMYNYQYLSGIAHHEKDYKVGLNYADSCAQLATKLKVRSCECQFRKVTCFNRLGFHKKSQDLLKEIEPCLNEHHTQSFRNSAKIYELDNALRIINRQDLAIMIDTIIHERDSLSITKAREQLLEVETRYETEKKEAENQLLKKDNDIAQAQIARQRTILGGAGITLLSLFVLIWNLISSGRERKKNLQILTEKNEAIQALNREVAHRTKNHLALATALLSKDKRQSDDPKVRSALSENENRLRTLSLINQKLNNATQAEQLDLKEYLQELCDDLMYSLEKSRMASLALDCGSLKLDSEKVLRLGLITNELITNSFKHARTKDQSLDISLAITFEKDELKYNYSDNGSIHADFKEDKDSQGMGLIDSLWSQLHGNYKQSFNPNYQLEGSLKYN